MRAIQFELHSYDAEKAHILCGNLNQNLQAIERHFGVEIAQREATFRITGVKSAAHATQVFIEDLYQEILADNIDELPESELYTLLNATKSQQEPTKNNFQANFEIQIHNRVLRPRTANQQIYIQLIQENDVNFGIGPAGTGKTYLAMACAVAAFEKGLVKRLVLVRPAVEAGEKLGFLPGDLAQKVDPYLRPMYDALFDLMGVEKVTKLIERQVIEIAPLAYMRGRTINDAFIVLDESQNTTKEQMKMFLTRIGFNSTAIITGDITQVDLPSHITPGLKHAIQVLQNIDGISMTFFDKEDVVRHPIVQKIVSAYEKYEQA